MKAKNQITVGIIMACFLFFFSCNCCNTNAKNDKLALIVAVADYPTEGGWAKISSDKDVPLIKNALLKQGFQEKDITIILNDKASYEGIKKALKDLTNKATPGDIVVFHYSGHGQQIRDDNDDEVDGYDEAMVPFDAQMRFKKDEYTGQYHLRDDEFGSLLDDLRAKVGPQGEVLVVLDACHSGTATRGFGIARGTSIKMEEPGYQPKIKDGTEQGFMEKSRGSENIASLAPIVVFSGAGADELNHEYTDEQGNSYGSLSYAFSMVLSAAPKNSTYRGLFDKIKIEMNSIAPKQTPQAEGDMDKGILGGQAVDQKPYFMVKEWVDDKTLVVNAGNLNGIYDNTTISIYPINTTDPANKKPIAEGTIANSSAIESDIILNAPITKDQALNSWVFIKDQSYGDLKTKVKIVNNDNKKFFDKLIAEFSKVPVIQITDKSPNLVIEIGKQENNTSLLITTTDDIIIFNKTFDPSQDLKNISGTIEAIKSFSQVALLRNLQMTDKNFDVTFEIIPVTVKKVGTRFVEDQKVDLNTKLVDGNLAFNDGDCFKLKVTNDGYEPAYYQVLDLQADNKVGLLVPGNGKTAQEYRIYPGESIELRDIFVFGEPYGKEEFKLIATEKPLNLEGIITSRGESESRGETNPFEMLLAESFAQTRAATLSAPPSSANIFSKVMTVKKK